MEKYKKLTVSFVKRQYYPHLLLTLLLIVFSGGFVSFKALEEPQAAKVMEMYVTFTGILLFTPLFMPEQDKEIWNLERSKSTSMWKVYLPRVLLALLVCVLVTLLFVGLMKKGGGHFHAGILLRGACCEILFLGSIGFFASAVTNQVVIGYMAAVVYYAVNIGGGKFLGRFALFKMMQGEYGTWTYWLFGAAVLLSGGILAREKMRF
ncbi:hypothetical protein [Parablautia muri]|nr:hypothetical protein [Parablautia muri]